MGAMGEKKELRKQKLEVLDSPESVSINPLAAVLLGSSDARLKSFTAALSGTQAQVIRASSLPCRDDLDALLGENCDVLILDMNDDPERCLDLIEVACRLHPCITVIAWATANDPELIVRCMRAGAREFLHDPLLPAPLADALVRASVHRDEINPKKKPGGKCMVFIGAKGGAGATTLASNFALSLARESGESVVLLDLDLQLGDAALSLGLSNEFSTVDALENESRLDSDLVKKLLVRHDSGLEVMGAPDTPNSFHVTRSAVMKLVNILRGDFAWVVIDADAHHQEYGEALFAIAQKVYLVSQVTVTELRNSNRLIAAYFRQEAGRRLEVVLNRWSPRPGEIAEPSIAKALTVAPAWKIPADEASIRESQNTATALVSRDGPVSRVITRMARAACGKPLEDSKKRRFGLW